MSRLLADPGPGMIDDDELRRWAERDAPAGDSPVPEPEPVAPDLDPDVRWEEAQVRTLLKIQGGALHMLLSGGHPEAWKYTKDDLSDIAGPLTRIANRYPLSRAAAAAGDELALVAALGKYGIRSMVQRGQAIAQAELDALDEQPEPTARVAPDGRVTPAAERRDVWTGEPL